MKQKLVPILSVVVGLLAFLLTQQYLSKQRQKYEEYKSEIDRRNVQVPVIAAAEDLTPGTIIKQSDIGRISVAKASVRGRTVLPEEHEFLIGRKTLLQIKKYEPILWSDVEGGSDAGISLAPMISKRLRAVSLSVSGAASVSGLVQPNDRVDILGTFSLPSKTIPGEMEMVTLTLLQDITILATGQKLAKSRTTDTRSQNTGYSTVTVEVLPSEAEILVFAQQMQGRLTLTLRNPTAGTIDPKLREVNFEYLTNAIPSLNATDQRSQRYRSN
jgi:pilus assembly protein CpaB